MPAHMVERRGGSRRRSGAGVRTIVKSTPATMKRTAEIPYTYPGPRM